MLRSIILGICLGVIMESLYLYKAKEEQKSVHISCEREYYNCKNYQSKEDDCDWEAIWWCIHQ